VGSQGSSPQGDTGLQGQQGSQGAQGASPQGAQGPQGLQGDLGAQGASPQGLQGAKGQKGENALGTLITGVSPGLTWDTTQGVLKFNNGGNTYILHMYVSGSY